MATKAPSIKIDKLDAARRQLRTAIALWFDDGDPVSVHTLASAAYEIVHVVSKKKGRTDDLIFDSLVIKDEYRSEYNIFMKSPASFFKHANKDHDSSIEFFPILTEMFILFTVYGLELLGEKKNDEEAALINWLSIHKPEYLTQKGREDLAQRLSVEQLDYVRQVSKREFLESFKFLRRKAGL